MTQATHTPEQAGAYNRMVDQMRQARAENEARPAPVDAMERTLGAVYQVRSKPTTAKFGPHQGKEVVKVFYRPILAGVASRKEGSEGVVGSGGAEAREEWVPVERVKQWRQNVRDLFGVDPSKVAPADVDDHSELNARAVDRVLASLRKGAKP